jgi:hypothetical protein
MQPADTILITICSQAFRLKASLRAARYLNQKYDGFGNLARAISTGTFEAYQDLIEECCSDPAALNAFLKPFHDPSALMTPLGDSMLANRDELLEFVLVLSGGKRSRDDTAPVGEPMTFEEYFVSLFKLGTGWVGWSAKDTNEASPQEIMQAAEACQAKLKACFGGKSDEAETIDIKDESARAELNALGDLSVTSMRAVR